MVEKERKENAATVDDSGAESKPWYRSSLFMIALSCVVFAVLLSAWPLPSADSGCACLLGVHACV